MSNNGGKNADEAILDKDLALGDVQLGTMMKEVQIKHLEKDLQMKMTMNNLDRDLELGNVQ